MKGHRTKVEKGLLLPSAFVCHDASKAGHNQKVNEPCFNKWCVYVSPHRKIIPTKPYIVDTV